MMIKSKVKFRGIINLLVLLVFIFFNYSCAKEDSITGQDKVDILDKLKGLEGLEVIEIPPVNGYSRMFQIDIIQPVDHENPNGAKFKQRLYLMHVDEKEPMVFAPSGYWISPSIKQELATSIRSNLLNVAHRYYLEAEPDFMDFKYLTIKQSVDDFHTIVALFKEIYTGKWISSGRSKSGLSVLFHKKYYPQDVDASIAFVAPLMFGKKDPRFPSYLEKLGDESSYSKITKIQEYILRHRSEMLNLIDKYIQSSSDIFSMDRDSLLELNVLDYPFTYWQLNTLPLPDTSSNTLQEIFNHFTSVISIDFYSEWNLRNFRPSFYQFVTEIGAPEYQMKHLSHLLKKIDPNSTGNPSFEFALPRGVSYSYNDKTIPEINEWLQNSGNNIIYIYGKNDPWTAGAIELKPTCDAICLIQNNFNHKVLISDLDDPSIVYSTLSRWLGITIKQK